jgi:hypothetical protein
MDHPIPLISTPATFIPKDRKTPIRVSSPLTITIIRVPEVKVPEIEVAKVPQT